MQKHFESMVQDRMILINTNNDDCRFHTKISHLFFSINSFYKTTLLFVFLSKSEEFFLKRCYPPPIFY